MSSRLSYRMRAFSMFDRPPPRAEYNPPTLNV
jgi:hypothetical protein